MRSGKMLFVVVGFSFVRTSNNNCLLFRYFFNYCLAEEAAVRFVECDMMLHAATGFYTAKKLLIMQFALLQRFTSNCNCVEDCCFCLHTSSLTQPQFQRQPQSIISILLIAAVRRWFGNWNFNLKLSDRHGGSVRKQWQLSAYGLHTHPPTCWFGNCSSRCPAVACNPIPSDVALMIAI